MKQILIFTVLSILVACSAKLLNPTQADADRMQSQYPGYSLAELSEGKMLYEQHCGNCHKLHNPKSHNEAQWQEIVPEMAKKVNKNGPVLDATGEEKILRYVITMGSAGR